MLKIYRLINKRSNICINLCQRKYNNNNSLLNEYNKQINNNIITYDDNQIKILKYLDRLKHLLESPSGIIVAGDDKQTKRLKGLYIHGGVGTGKTMLMDLFYENCHIDKKSRVHFHKFMLNIHKQIHEYKNDEINKDIIISENEAIKYVGESIANNSKLLCFDEFQVTDVYDAIILTTLFRELWSHGTILVATSNRPPRDLYQDGVNRQFFLPFIESLENECIVKELSNSTDYRINLYNDKSSNYLYPNSEVATKELYDLWLKDIYKRTNTYTFVDNIPIPVLMNRVFSVKHANESAKVCWIEFEYICNNDFGAADYQALCNQFNTIYLNNIKKLNIINHDIARRFITFIDEVYDAKIRLLCTAETSPNLLFTILNESNTNKIENLGVDHHWSGSTTVSNLLDERPINSFYENNMRGSDITTHSIPKIFKNDDDEEQIRMLLKGELASIQELSFAFRRASSRLKEMTSIKYHNEWFNKYYNTVDNNNA